MKQATLAALRRVVVALRWARITAGRGSRGARWALGVLVLLTVIKVAAAPVPSLTRSDSAHPSVAMTSDMQR